LLIYDFIIHMGFPKCGSTNLQRHLYTNRSWLAQKGFVYPSKVKARHEPKHQHLVNDLFGAGLNIEEIELYRRQNTTTILSSEGLLNHLYEYPAENLQAAARYFSQHNTVGLIVRRSPEGWILSYYCQCVLNPPSRYADRYATALPFEQFTKLESVCRLADHEAIVGDACHAYGASKIVELDLSENLLADIHDALGIPVPEGMKWSSVNASPPQHVVEMARQINCLEIERSRRSLCIRLLLDWAGKRNTAHEELGSIELDKTTVHFISRAFDCLEPSRHDPFFLELKHINSFQSWLRSRIGSAHRG